MADKPEGEKARVESEGQAAEKPETVVNLADEKAKRWKALLLKTGGANSKPRKVMANAVIALKESPEWKGSLRYDENSFLVMLERQPPAPWPKKPGKWVPRAWTDQDDRLLNNWLAKHQIDLGISQTCDAVATVAGERPFHPIREYLQGLKWDGVPRVDKWLTTYLGAEDCEYHSAVGKRWLVSGVARILRPGVQADHMLILEGLQGSGKSSVLRALGDPWFTDEARDLGSRDTAMALAGRWIVEFAELESFKGTSQERLKAFISRRVDRFRPPWGRQVIDSPRQCIFAGTTNRDGYLGDETGERRYWPVRCHDLKVSELARDRDQLWAEAKAMFEAGAIWWLETKELRQLASRAQDDRFDEDPLQGQVEALLGSEFGMVRLEKIICEIMDLEIQNVSRIEQLRFAKMLRRAGWERCTAFDENGIKRRYYRRIAGMEGKEKV